MAQDMSTFFTGMRRNTLNSVPTKTRTFVKSGAGTGGATSKAGQRRLQSGGGVGGAAGSRTGAGSRGGAGAGGRTGAGLVAGSGSHFNRRRPVTTRLTGGGPAPPSGIFQSPNALRRQPTGAATSSPRRFREIEWIMKPSKNFVQCSESSSEDNFPEIQTLRDKTGKRRSSWSSGLSVESKNNSRETLKAAQPAQQLVNLLKSSCRPIAGQVSQMRAKKRPSRVFCVPDQRIIHSEELLQAQMLQMHPRKMKSPNRYSYNPVPATLAPVQVTPSVSESCDSPSRKASEKVLIQPENPYLEPATGLISCSPTPLASPKLSQAQVEAASRKQSLCPFEKPPSSSSSTSLSSSSCPSQILVGKPNTESNRSNSNINSNICNSNSNICNTNRSNNSSNDSSLSSSGTECSAERVVQRYCNPSGGSKALKLTSTVIKIMPNKASRTSQRASKVGQHSRIKLRSKTTSQFLKKTTKDPAIIAPLNQSISPPRVSLPKIKVSTSIINQSVSQVVNQLTEQLKKAMGEEHKTGLTQKQTGTATATATPTSTEVKWPRQLGKKTSIYLLMDQAKHQDQDQTPDEPSTPKTTKNDWVIQPMKQQMISPAMDQPRNPPVNPYLKDSKEAVEHNYDIYLSKPNDHQGKEGNPVISRFNPEPIRTQARQPMIQRNSRKQTLATKPSSQHSLKSGSRIPSRNTFENQNKCQPRSPYYRPTERSARNRSRRQTLISQPVSLNRIPRPQVTAAVPQSKQVQAEEVTSPAGKIVLKTQHKVPRTMEDGIDMSYQYFVSLPLKRGRKPQAVRYLYRPMVRNLNGQTPNGGRRASRRAKRRRGAAAAGAASEQSPKLDPALKALGGAPLPLELPPEEKTSPSEEYPTFIFNSEEALNSPYPEPPLKLKSCYKAMLEELEQMPYPEERLCRRRRHSRRTRAVGGSDQLSTPEYEVQPAGVQSIAGGGGDDKKPGTPVIVWSGRSAPPVPRTTVVNYQAKATHVRTTTGAPMMFHQPLRLTLKQVDCRPMIRTITYESIEQEEREELEELKRRQEKLKLEQEKLELKVEQLQLKPRQEKEQLERERVSRERMSREPLSREEMEQIEMRHYHQELEKQQPQDPAVNPSEPITKSVSFHPEPVIVSRESTVAALSSSSTSSIVASKGKAKKHKTKKTHAKGKGKGKAKNRSKGKGRK